MKITLGGEPKKVAALGGLFVILIAVWWFNREPSIPAGANVSTTPTKAPASPVPIPPKSARTEAARPQTRAQQAKSGGLGVRGSLEEFRPSLKPKRGEEVDLSSVDPTLHFNRLAQLQKVSVEGGIRSLFDFGAAPPPLPKVAPIKPGPIVQFIGPPAPPKPQPPAPPPPKPPPPPIPLKFYGFLASPRGGPERGFFLDGDEIVIGVKDELIRGKYKIVRVGRTSAEVEDVPNNNKQTLPLVQESQV